MKDIRKYIVPTLFISMLLATSAAYIAVPDRDISESENRTLASLPSFSLESLSSGKFTSGMISYMNDQFPFREAFMEIGNNIEETMHLESKVSGGTLITNTGNVSGGAGERLNGNDTEIVAKEFEELEESYNSLIIDDSGRAIEYYSFSDKNLFRYAKTLNSLAYELRDINLYSMVVPTSSEFYLSEDLKKDNNSQKKALDKVYKKTSSKAKRVNVLPVLKREAKNPDNYLYFKTDHHWTQLGAYHAYTEFCKSAGFKAVPMESMETAVVEGDFLGSFTRMTDNPALSESSDTIVYFVPDEVEDVTAYTDADMAVSYDAALIIPPGDIQNKYMVFLGGDHPLIHIKTYSESQRSLVIVKDSFGNALIPLLVPHFKNIYAIDPRTAHTNLAQFCSLHSVTDVLIENYAFSLSSNGASLLLESLLEAGSTNSD